jgi:hypothetical protein
MKARIQLALLLCAAGAAVALADWKADVGYTTLKARLGAETPTGLGIAVTQAEAPDGSDNYLPDTTNAQFVGKTIIAMSGSGGGVSSHATTVGAYYYGLTTSIAPGIDPAAVYEANNWIGSGFLLTQSRYAPLFETRRTQNHSWIGTAQTDERNADILRRIDMVVDRDGVVVAAGVNNGAGSTIPKLLGSAYNVLAVGLTNGNSSYGPTTVDVAGRVRPDLVAPAGQTSWATPMVASSAALLLESADTDGILSGLSPAEQRTGKALLAKALLMGGATKTEFTDWRKGFATPSTDGTVPLDYRYGAGELNIDNSHRILAAGRQPASPSTDVALTGWDYGAVTASGSRLYFFDVPAFSYVDAVSILVTWNRHVTVGPGNPATLTPSLANIDLRLYEAQGFLPAVLVDQSVSLIDNVEHVFEVTSDQAWDYAITWDAALAATIAFDFDGDGDVDLADFATFQACFNGPNRPPSQAAQADCEKADFDHDGDVDLVDFLSFQACFNGPNRPPACL